VLDNFSTGKRENLLPFEGKIELIEGDLRDYKAVRQAVEEVDYVLHQGALPSVPRSIAAPLTTNEVNVVGTLNLLIAARYAGVKRVVYASSSSVYGDTAVLPKREDMAILPQSPYGVSKLAAEQYCRAFWEVYGLETVALRYFNIFGPHQDSNSQYGAVIPCFITALLRGDRPVVYGDGQQSRDFTYVDNVVQANLLAATRPGIAGEVFNIACGNNRTVLELAVTLQSLVGEDIVPCYADPRPGDIRHSWADISQARERLGYEVKIGFEEGLSQTLAWYRDGSGEG
jgi:UDP-glucose 4-epimerase